MMQNITEEQIQKSFTYSQLIEVLREGFRTNIVTPDRHHHSYKNPDAKSHSTLLLMPSWEEGKDLGVKIVTLSPENSKYKLPSIQGVYILQDATTGVPKAIFDARALTRIRTAAASALAASYLAAKDARSMLMIGTGALGHELPLAHAAIRDMQEVMVWGRNMEKAADLVIYLKNKGLNATVAEKLDEATNYADIVSLATLSQKPLIQGKWLREGQHIDLVGAYKPDGRESDDEVIRCSSVFVDTRRMAPKEAGDLVIPISKGVMEERDIKADLFELCQGEQPGRTSNKEITVFKSVGHGLEDLVTARMILKNLNIETKDHD